MLKIESLAVTGRVAALSAEVAAGSRVHIIGPNGAGKSTLLASMAGMLPAEGEISLAGQPLSALTGQALSRYRSYLRQQYLPLSVMPVFQYLSLHQPAGVAPAALEETLMMLCERLHLADKLASSITRLSGGEWQRVRIVAALLQVWPTINPQGRLLLLDEPANSLDIAHQQATDQLVDAFCAAGGIAVVSDHDLNHTLHHAHHVWLMNNGKVIKRGSPGEVMQPANLTPVYGVYFQQHQVAGKDWILTC